MPFVDTHVHLHFPDFDQDREDVIRRAREAGVELFVNVGTDPESSAKSLELSRQYDFVYAAAGVHPHDAAQADAAALREIDRLLEDKRMVAIGEVGLDFYRDHSPREKQKEVLAHFIAVYKKIAKPLILHCRDAYDDLIELLKAEGAPPYRGIIHCFSADRSVMMRLLELGFYISFAGPLTYKKNDALRGACKACPLERLVLETDAPFLPPQTQRGKRNESSLMLETAQCAAGLHGISMEELGVRTTANAKKVFGLC